MLASIQNLLQPFIGGVLALILIDKKNLFFSFGRSKISSKIAVIKNLIPKFDNIIIVGGMANNILKYKDSSSKSVAINTILNIIS